MFRYLTIESGLSHADANAIIQDQKGYIWIATYSGLDRYDGYRVKSYFNQLDPIHKSIQNRLMDITLDNQGKVWIASFHEIQCFDSKYEKYIPIKVENENTNRTNFALGFRKIVYGGSNLYTINVKGNFSVYHILDDSTLRRETDFSIDRNCNSLYKDSTEQVWVGTDKGLWRIDTLNKVTYISFPQISGAIESVYVDKYQNILVGSGGQIYLFEHGASRLNTNGENLLSNGMIIALGNDARITDIVKTDRGDFWVSTIKGLHCLSKSKNNFHVVSIYEGGFTRELNSDYINKLLFEKSGTLFIATYAGGVNILNLNKNPFITIQQTFFGDKKLSGNIVRAIVEDKNTLWIGTNSDGITTIDLKTNKTGYLHTSVTKGLRSNNIRSFLVDNENNLWIGNRDGLDILAPDRKTFLYQGKQEELFPYKTKINDIRQDCYKQIWVSSGQGLYRIRKNGKGVFQTEDLTMSGNPVFKASEVITLYIDSIYPEVFFSYNDKLVRLVLDKDGEIEKTYTYEGLKGKSQSLSSSFICSIQRENDSVLWLGTIGGRLNRLTMLPEGGYYAKELPEDNSIKWKDVEGLLRDNNGNLWLAGNGLARYSPVSNKTKIYSIDEQNHTNSYKVGASYKGASGNLYFGGNKGLVYFNPEQIVDHPFPATPDISELLVNNKPLVNINECAISAINEIDFSYNQNNFTFFFTALHFAQPLNCKFRYQMKGYDKEVQLSREGVFYANYANLPYGEYTFELQASNNDEVWSETIRILKIHITPPWWLSIWAKVIYLILILAILILINSYLIRLSNLKNQLKITELKEQQKEQMHQLQLSFFTNISHEFRTPLTLILGTVEKIENELMIKNQTFIHTLKKNTRRLLLLVNELMDFRKAETGSFHLSVQQKDIQSFIEMIAEDFQSLEEYDSLVIYKKNQNISVWFDPGIIEKIVLNLMNNSFKYTSSDNRHIEIEVLNDRSTFSPSFSNFHRIGSEYSAKSYFYIRIFDNGYGISKESIQKVFDRYYQIEDSDHDPHLGSGVGLALVKSLILLHKGYLEIYSERKKGTEILVAIPCNFDDYSGNERSDDDAKSVLLDFSGKQEEKYIAPTRQEVLMIKNDELIANKHSKIVLIVEDNKDVRALLSESLSPHYTIKEACNGVEALSVIQQQLPDIIISDLMMPRMDGNKLCREIKCNPQTSNIPFVLLTAKDGLATQIESVKCGAEAFLTKPVSLALLTSVLNNLLMQNKRMKQQISTNYLYLALEENLQEQDKEFYQQLISTIEGNINNVELDVDLLSKQLSISRTKLYQRVKEVVNLPVIELVRSIRMRKAAQLMVEENLSIAEITQRIGMQHQSHFSSSFKKEFGMTPTQFIKQMTK